MDKRHAVGILVGLAVSNMNRVTSDFDLYESNGYVRAISEVLRLLYSYDLKSDLLYLEADELLRIRPLLSVD